MFLIDDEDVASAVDKGKGDMLAGEGSSGGSATRMRSLGCWIPDSAGNHRFVMVYCLVPLYCTVIIELYRLNNFLSYTATTPI